MEAQTREMIIKDIAKYYLFSIAKYKVEKSEPNCNYITGEEYLIDMELLNAIFYGKVNGEILFKDLNESYKNANFEYLKQALHRFHNEGRFDADEFKCLTHYGIDVFGINRV